MSLLFPTLGLPLPACPLPDVLLIVMSLLKWVLLYGDVENLVLSEVHLYKNMLVINWSPLTYNSASKVVTSSMQGCDHQQVWCED